MAEAGQAQGWTAGRVAGLRAIAQGLQARLRERPDLEHEMGFNRLIFCALIATYLWLVPSPDMFTGLQACAVYFAFALVLITAMVLQPRISHPRRIVAMIGDLTALGTEMHISGSANAGFYPLYLWIIFGNGFRFGLGYLFLTLGVALASFGVVVATTPYWSGKPMLSGSLLLALLVLPAYASGLIRKLSEAKRIAEEANRAKSRFLANVSHELRTPLNAILGSTSLLRGTPLEAEQRELTDALDVGTRALLSLIGGILDFSRIEANRMPLRLEPFDLPDLLADIRELLGPQTRLKNLRLRFHVTQRVPEIIRTDRRHLHEVLLNLASNAIKFTSAGEVMISVDARPCGPERLRFRFEVSDTGIGIRQEARERIFESFTQAEPTIIDRFGGTGLGLTIARQLVTLMGGTIGVESVFGESSTFWFTIECDEVVAATTPTDQMAIPNIRVVLLCDDALMGGRIKRQLEALGLEAERASDEPDALARLARKPNAGVRLRTLLLLQRDSLHPAATLDEETGRFLGSADVPIIGVATLAETGPPADIAIRRYVGTWISQRPDPAELRAALRKVAARPEQHAEPDSVAGSNAVPKRSLHVLVADDNDINLRVVAKVLERAGHSMRLVRNGVEALDALEQERFDIVLMDVNMPVMNGIEATKLYRFASLGEPRVPIVALTADATQETERDCLEAGMDACLTKPIEVFRLAAALERIAHPAAPPASSQSHRSSSAAMLPIRQVPQHPIFDDEMLDNLRTLGGEEFLDEMVASFAGDAVLLAGNIAGAAQDGDLLMFRSEIHALRSCAANVGALAIQEACKSCRDVGPAELQTRGVELARRVSDEVVRLEGAVAQSPNRYLRTPSAASELPT
ncbi:response regulator [Lichenicola cladoniae]|uniref:histidine kinase n=1 Tax=Lichenicola cladoniae TaxID=1484109 RepID=A0A6M8HSQ5_9PROT|nr:ATP-binding protein [Lichenicola cladoniae]NPD65579.1 response regulator [Acetobacteraceae bacterium]QKE91380.1 response regulator [Lichenicola cladoniae]